MCNWAVPYVNTCENVARYSVLSNDSLPVIRVRPTSNRAGAVYMTPVLVPVNGQSCTNGLRQISANTSAVMTNCCESSYA